MELPHVTPPWTGIGKRIESMTRKALYDFSLLETPVLEGVSHLAVALSGGKDSLALLYMLKAISGRGFPPFDLSAIHVSGTYTCGAGVSLHYLEAICKQLNVPFIVREANQKLEGLECYGCSRKRRSLLFDTAKEIGATTIAFGHHRDDHAQTLLMNLLHKGEFAGNLPKVMMYDYGITIIRPFIYVGENEIKIFAKQHKFLRITCQCPVGQNSMRKQVDRLLSEIEELFPNARSNIASAGILYGSHKALKRKDRGIVQ